MTKPNETLLKYIRRQTMILTAATYTLGGFRYGLLRLLNCQRAAGQAFTLPASTGKRGKFRLYTGTSITSNTTTIKAAGTDTINGVADISGTTAGTFGTASNTNTITLNGSTQGGLVGSYIDLEDVGGGAWSVRAHLTGSGTAATPFSNS